MTWRSSLLSGRRPDCGESYPHQGWAGDKISSPGRTWESIEGPGRLQGAMVCGHWLNSSRRGTHTGTWVWVGWLFFGSIPPVPGHKPAPTWRRVVAVPGLVVGAGNAQAGNPGSCSSTWGCGGSSGCLLCSSCCLWRHRQGHGAVVTRGLSQPNRHIEAPGPRESLKNDTRGVAQTPEVRGHGGIRVQGTWGHQRSWYSERVGNVRC